MPANEPMRSTDLATRSIPILVMGHHHLRHRAAWDPARRLLKQVTVDDAAQADEMFSVLMGEDVEARRSFITRNAKDVRFLDI